MDKTTVKRTSMCLTKETNRQLQDLKMKLGENSSQVITRAIQLLHYSMRFPNIPPQDFLRKGEDDAGSHKF
jgi:predicted DNA-binding protein